MCPSLCKCVRLCVCVCLSVSVYIVCVCPSLFMRSGTAPSRFAPVQIRTVGERNISKVYILQKLNNCTFHLSKNLLSVFQFIITQQLIN